MIYSPLPGNTRLSIGDRALALAISAGCLAVLFLATRLPPNLAGMGTHRQLGLNACTFLGNTGLPCPSCGMTTSFSWFVRGNLAASFYTQPAGLFFAILTTMVFWASLYIALTGKPAHQILKRIPTLGYLLTIFGVGLLGWAWKIFIHVKGMDGWG